MNILNQVTPHVSEAALGNIRQWLTEPKYRQYREELERMIANEEWKELENAFFKVIEFGTAGRRGITGPGSNRINRVTIGESAQALCLYAQSFDAQANEKGIVIACDTRLSSPELSQYTALVCAANGFKTYIFDSFRSTPELSFAVRHLGCSAGIVISASHNPPADNGFKAYWSDGAQIASPHDRGVLDMASKTTEIRALDNFEKAVAGGRITIIGEDVDSAYLGALLKQSENNERELSIVYSPLHGAGQTNTLRTLQLANFSQILTVDEQMTPDGNFPTIPNGKPNPEEPTANKMAVELLLKKQADIAITNDPDADRIAVIVRQGGTAIQLTGNQACVLATDYSLYKLQQKNQLTPNHYVVKTIVTTDMLRSLANKYGVNIYDNLLIGFKYIGEIIRNKENTNEVFVIGGEESYGMLKGTYARDKDGASAALVLAEFAAELKKEGKTLVDRLMELYRELGMYIETLDVAVYPGADGFATMQNIMSSLRASPPASIGDEAVTAVIDYQALTRTLDDNRVEKVDCVAGNVLVFECGSPEKRITIRPSGTEPKLKFYTQWKFESSSPETDYAEAEQYLHQLFTSLSEEALKRV